MNGGSLKRTKRRRVLRIKDWGSRFENNRSRDVQHLRWVPIPNQMDEHAYANLVSHENGAAHYGVWIACIEIASRSQPRGTLLRADGVPHDPPSLALVSRLPIAVFEEAIPRLMKVGWLEEVPLANARSPDTAEETLVLPQRPAETRQKSAAIPHPPALKGMEGNGRGENNTDGKGRTRNPREGSYPKGMDEREAPVTPSTEVSGGPVASGMGALPVGPRGRLSPEEVEARRRRQKAAVATWDLKGNASSDTELTTSAADSAASPVKGASD